MMEAPLLALVGPTASGKTAAGVRIAEAIGTEIVSIDSATVYRGMDAQTAKPTPAERARVPHHMIDVAEPEEAFSVARFQRLAHQAISGIRGRGHPPLLVGGSGLYYRAVVDGLSFPGTEPAVRRMLQAEAAVIGPGALHRRLAGLDPEATARIEPMNVRRTVRALEVAAITGRPFSSFARDLDRYAPGRVRAAGIDLPRALLYRRIERRAVETFPRLLEETRRLLERGAGSFITSIQAIGYAEAMQALQGRLRREEALARIVRRVKALSRRQMAWFRRDPRITWFLAGEGGAEGEAERLMAFLAPAGVPDRAAG